MSTKQVTLPSGRQIALRAPTALDMYRIQGSLPDLSAVATGPAGDAESGLRIGIKMICVLSVAPKFWADLRPDHEIVASPQVCPAGFVEFDLSMEDFAAASAALTAMVQEAQQVVGPLSETAPA